MTALEDRLHDALVAEGSTTTPSPDLFSRVVDSIGEDRLRRRHFRRVAATWVVATAAAAGAVAVFTPRGRSGGLLMPWWVLEVATNVALVAIALWLGPFIKRFGRAYAADVFHDNPVTGKSYIVLTDIVYYLIFAAYILFWVHFAPEQHWNAYVGQVTAAQLGQSLTRVAGILLIIGILHGVNIIMMPVLGRLFSLNRRLPPHHP
jgi:hypothetical protein